MARDANDQEFREQTNFLAKAIADYKVASKTVKSLESQGKPKQSKAKAKAKA